MLTFKYYLSKWYIKVLAFFLSFFLIIFVLSFLPFSYDIFSDNEEINKLIAYFINFLIIAIPLIFVEQLSGTQILRSYGLANFHKLIKYKIHTFLCVFILFSIVLGLNCLIGNCSNNIGAIKINLPFLVYVIIIFIVALQEELVFRAFLINSLELRYSSSTSIIYSSIVFAALHFFNNNYTYISAINTFLAGLLLGLLYIKSSSLWLPVFFHFYWNLLQPIMLNSPISGINFEYSIFKIDQSKNLYFLNGGAYGFESTIAATLILVLSLLYFSKIETLNPYNSSYKFRMNYKLDSFLLKYDNK